MTHQLMRRLVSVFVLVAVLCQGTLVLAGTTGQLTGTITDATTRAPIVGAKVTAASPSQIAISTTDSSGHFAFLSLAPDTYTVSVEAKGFEATSATGVTVIADNARTVNIPIGKELRTIGVTRSRSASSLVKPGTTSDVYAIDPTQQGKVSAAGGGGTQNSAFSALSTVPGVFVAPGQSGYVGAASTLSIRGGDYDQIGYEIDGVPVNRSFDNYPSGPTSSLGQQQLQVYTGGGPASSEAQGLSGFINQVIRTGTSPGFANADLGIGGPAFYHKASIEFGGATPDRNLSYYVGLGGYDQDFRYVDQFNGRGVGQLYGTPVTTCIDIGAALAPSCYVNGQFAGTGVKTYNNFSGGSASSYYLGDASLFGTSMVDDRDSVANVHIGIPRKNGLKDDIQLLGMVNYINTTYYTSTNDLGGAPLLNALKYVPSYSDGFQYAGATGVLLPDNYRQLTSLYYFPSTSQNRAPNGLIPASDRDSTTNNQGIFKLQYTHPLSQSALIRLYGYTYYSDWLQHGPQSTFANYFGPASADYELSSHTRGVSGTIIDQVNAQNLVQLQGSYTTATALRDNNTTMLNSNGSRSIFGYVVDSSNPTNGICYALTGGKPLSCGDSNAATAAFSDAYAGSIAPASGTCGGGPCQYLVTSNGQIATYNRVTPKFYAASLTDDFHPTLKLAINGGIRMDIFQFEGADTNTGLARTFFYNAFNLDHCIDATGNLVDKGPTDPCPAGSTAANFQNPSGRVQESYTVFQPRLGFTYTFDPSTVFRAAYGRYAQAPNSAFQQYDTLQPNAPRTLYSVYGFQKFGFTSPNHTVRPPTSNNYDFSIEHQFPHQVSIKVSPFLRKTQDQIQQFYLNQQTSFVSGLNVGRQTSEGVELEVDKGDFASNGLSGKLSLSYTNSYINYQALPNGGSVIDPINNDIANYNAYTSACAPGGSAVGKKVFGSPLCGAQAVAASPCYTVATPEVDAPDGTVIKKQVPGTPTACAPGTIANPYWNAPVQNLLDPQANYPTYDTFPAGVGSSVNAYGAPYVANLILNYKRGPFAVTPIFQLFAGQKYGAPETTYGVNPELCNAVLAGSTGTAGDPRYPYGAVGGAGYDATKCTVQGQVIPSRYTKTFDGIGAFTAPGIAQLHLQMSYDVSKNLTFTANFANILNTCFGGSKEPWNVSGACGYGLLAGGSTGDVGNQYNPGAVIQPYLNSPYLPNFAASPFNVYVNAKLRI